MRIRVLLSVLLMVVVSTYVRGADTLIKNVVVYTAPERNHSRRTCPSKGDRITAIGKNLSAQAGEIVRDEHGPALAPDFIDMHSHHDHGIFDDLDAEAATRHGVTTVFVGQDGDSNFPLADFFGRLERTPAAINFASMIGHATLRHQVMGNDLHRPSTPEELKKMKDLLARELEEGAFGLSSGLEYEYGHFATTEDMMSCLRRWSPAVWRRDW
jgi:N-acyl-D-amino-acid deacylase